MHKDTGVHTPHTQAEACTETLVCTYHTDTCVCVRTHTHIPASSEDPGQWCITAHSAECQPTRVFFKLTVCQVWHTEVLEVPR